MDKEKELKKILIEILRLWKKEIEEKRKLLERIEERIERIIKEEERKVN